MAGAESGPVAGAFEWPAPDGPECGGAAVGELHSGDEEQPVGASVYYVLPLSIC